MCYAIHESEHATIHIKNQATGHTGQTHLHLNLSLAASGLKFLLLVVCLCFNLFDWQICSYML